MNLDKTRKFVSIVLMVLMISGIVFNAFNMVGHCASDSTFIEYATNVPCYYHQGSDFCIGTPWSIDDSVFEDIIANDYQLSFWLTADMDSCLGFYVQDWDGNNNEWVIVGCIPAYSGGYTWTFQSSSGVVSYSTTRYSNPPTNYYYKIYQDGTWEYNGYSQSGYSGFNLSYAFSNYSSSGPYHLRINQFIQYYPIWLNPSVSDRIVSSFDDSDLLLPYSGTGGGSDGHSKGGNIADYTYNQTDITDPADPSAVGGSSGWLSKILQGLNKLNKTIGDGFSNLVDNFKNFFNPIFGGIEAQLNQIIDKLGGADLDTNDTSLSDNFMLAFQGSKVYGVVTTFTTGRDLVYSIFNAVETNTPQVLRFEYNMPYINLGGGHSTGGSSGVYPYGRTLVLDFSWYESVRSIIVPFILVWLYIGMLVWLLRAIPGFISGVPSFNTTSVSDSHPSIATHYEVHPNGFLLRKIGRG